MKSSLRIALLSSLGALALTGCGGGGADQTKEQAALEKVAAPAGKTWAETVAPSADGGMVMGNPNAPIKIVEFASITCSHCADFSKTAMEDLKKDYIETGRVSLEVRHFVRDPLDATVAAVLRCAAPDRYFPLLDNAFAAQADLFAGAQGNPTAGEEAMKQAPNQRFTTLATAWKIDEFFKARGVTGDQINACLSDVGNITKLEEITNVATEKHKISGTPSFLINGVLAEGVSNWPTLRDRLRNLGAR
jgi:protein-disulfide isomerase